MIKILKSLKYDKTQYDKHFGIFYHMALSKYDKKKPMSTRLTVGCLQRLCQYNTAPT